MTRETHTASTTDARKRLAEAATRDADVARMDTARFVVALQLVADDVRAGHGDDLAEYVAASIREHFEMPLRMLAEHDAKARREAATEALRHEADRIVPGDHACYRPWCPQCSVRMTHERIQQRLRDRAEQIEAGS